MEKMAARCIQQVQRLVLAFDGISKHLEER